MENQPTPQEFMETDYDMHDYVELFYKYENLQRELSLYKEILYDPHGSILIYMEKDKRKDIEIEKLKSNYTHVVELLETYYKYSKDGQTSDISRMLVVE